MLNKMEIKKLLSQLSWKNIMIVILLTFIMTAAYFSNLINRENQLLERIWRSEGIESIVIGKIKSDEMNIEVGKFGMGRLVEVKGSDEQSIIGYEYEPYISHFGAQGFLFSFLYNRLGIQRIGAFRLLNAALLAIILVQICYFINKTYGFAYASIFYLVSLFSPWLTAFSRNLYWMAWTWFLPMLVGLVIDTKREDFLKFLPFMFLAVYFKSLCSNDYITTVMLSGISFLVISFFKAADKKTRMEIFKVTFLVGIVALLAFSLALVTHASIRGDTIAEGLKSIYQRDVLRRTIGGNPADYDPRYRTSLQASVMDVLRIYIFDWHTDVVYRVPGRKFFPFLFFSSLFIALYYIFRKQANRLVLIAMYLTFLIATISFYVLGKSHSYVHVAFNYVLWYFGFIQFGFFILIKFVKDHFPFQSRIIRKFWESL